MPDATLPHEAPRDWAAAFAALPLERPADDGWTRVSAGLQLTRRQPWSAWLAAAAALLLALALPWRFGLQDPLVDRARAPDNGITVSADPMATLQLESAQLEGLLELARDDRVASATAAVLSGLLETRLEGIDSALREPGLPPSQQLSLWRERVDTLRVAASFQSNRRWLAAHGEHYDGALVQVD